ncbi:MAG: translation initiation factor IF-2 associated domain-containing protein, partial [Betaproteobacteria bacterium]|nr:translation initiation factor IF-2 associated domain-containing protein [Betaproteobacteria bacterium]
MAQMNVSQFAKELGLPTALLLEQLQAAGLKKKLAEDTPLTEKDKGQLLEYLREVHGAKEAKQKITLTRRQTTEIKKADSTGKARTIHVEVRKKRVLVKRDAAETAPEAAEAAKKPVVDAEQIALREAEARQQAELAARQAEEAQKKQERQKRKQAQEAEAQEASAAVEAKPAAAKPAVEETKPAAAATEGTLHKPVVKPEEKAEKAVKKAAKKQPKEVVWQDEAVKKRSIKMRGDVSGGLGWRERKERHARHKEEESVQQAFAAPTEPIVREILVAETITVGA